MVLGRTSAHHVFGNVKEVELFALCNGMHQQDFCFHGFFSGCLPASLRSECFSRWMLQRRALLPEQKRLCRRIWTFRTRKMEESNGVSKKQLDTWSDINSNVCTSRNVRSWPASRTISGVGGGVSSVLWNCMVRHGCEDSGREWCFSVVLHEHRVRVPRVQLLSCNVELH